MAEPVEEPAEFKNEKSEDSMHDVSSQVVPAEGDTDNSEKVADSKTEGWLVLIPLQFVAIIVLVIFLVSENEKADIAVKNNRTAQEALANQQADTATLQNQVMSLRGEVEKVSRGNRELNDAVGRYRNENIKLKAELTSLEEAHENEIESMRAKFAAMEKGNKQKDSGSGPDVANQNAKVETFSLYQVKGAPIGDVLNVRAGPGTQHPIVVRLENGYRVTVTGSPVANGTDLWLPVKATHVSSNPSESWVKKGWAHAGYLEQVR